MRKSPKSITRPLNIIAAFSLIIVVFMFGSGCKSKPEVKIFPVQKEPDQPQMAEAGRGWLVLEDGYLKFQGLFINDFIIWPYGYTYKIQDNKVIIIDEKGQITATVGDFVKTGGGEMNDKPTAEKIVGQQLPEDFDGPYWVAGELTSR